MVPDGFPPNFSTYFIIILQLTCIFSSRPVFATHSHSQLMLGQDPLASLFDTQGTPLA